MKRKVFPIRDKIYKFSCDYRNPVTTELLKLLYYVVSLSSQCAITHISSRSLALLSMLCLVMAHLAARLAIVGEGCRSAGSCAVESLFLAELKRGMNEKQEMEFVKAHFPATFQQPEQSVSSLAHKWRGL